VTAVAILQIFMSFSWRDLGMFQVYGWLRGDVSPWMGLAT